MLYELVSTPVSSDLFLILSQEIQWGPNVWAQIILLATIIESLKYLHEFQSI